MELLNSIFSYEIGYDLVFWFFFLVLFIKTL